MRRRRGGPPVAPRAPPRGPSRAAAGQRGAGAEPQLTDALRRLAAVEPVWGVVYRGRRFDCGTQKGWLAANVQLALEDPDLRKVVLDVVKASQ